MKRPSSIVLALLTATTTMACLPGAVGAWRADVTVVETTGTPPATIADTWRVDAAVVSSPFAGQGDCGVRVEVIGLGVFELDGGVGCTDDAFEALLQEDAILETSEPTLEVVGVVADATVLTLQLDGGNPPWRRRSEGVPER